MIATVIMSVSGGAIISAIGYYNPVILPSMVLFCVGSGMLTTFTLDTPLSKWFGYQVITGLGVGAGFQIGVLVVQNTLPHDMIPVGTAGVQFFQSLGGAIFIAVAQSVFQTGLIDGVARDAPQLNPTLFINAGANQVRPILIAMGQEAAVEPVLRAYLQGLRNSYYISVACAGAAFVACLGFSWKSVKKDKKKVADNATAEEAAPTDGPETKEQAA
jgi:hypothetical protein